MNWTYNTTRFSQSSFTASASGSTMTGGQDAGYTTVYDSGSVTITVNGAPKSVSYGQDSTTTSIATALVNAINGDGAYPATASQSGATVNLTARTAGTVGNGYGLSAGTTYNSSLFSQPSFITSTSGSTLTGGANGQTIYDSGTVTLTVASCTPFTVNYQNGSTGSTVAAALRDAVNENGPCPVNASSNGSQISLTADGTGSSTNYALSSSATTNYSQYFSSASFTLSTSGMAGGADYVPATLATPAVTQYTYDTLDNLTQVVQSGSRQRTFAYNSLSQLLSAYNPESNTSSYNYDADGNLLTKTDARNITTTHSYDALHRLTGKTFSNGDPAATFLYDVSSIYGVNPQNPIGRLVKVEQNCAGSINSYDAMGRIIYQWQWTPLLCGSGSWRLDYSYNLIGGVTSYTNGVGVTFTQAFNAAAQVTQLTSSLNDAQHPGTLVSGITYNPAGALAQMTYGNGLVGAATYNNRLQPTEMRSYNASNGADTLKLNYGFTNANGNNNGNVIAWSATGAQAFSRSYTYDELNRLKTMSAPGEACSGLSWTYDLWANRTQQTTTAGACTQSQITVNTLNRIADPGYSYDAAGNLIAEPGKTYQYDAENRLTSINGGAVASYVYDANGRRVRKTVGGVSTEFIYDLAGNVVAEMQGTTWTVGYVYVGGQLIAHYKDSTTYFVHKDHLGSTRVLTQVDKTVRDSMDFLPFGEQIAGDTGTSHKFTGKERDSESGLDYFGARYYASTLGRFASPDPIFFQASMLADPQRFNQYAYVRNSPLVLIDPKGEATELTGDEEQRRKQLEALKQAVGSKAGAYLYENKVTTTDANGNTVTKYYVGIYTNGPDGKGPSFGQINTASAVIGGIIQSTKVVRAASVPSGTIIRDDTGVAVRIGSLNDRSILPTSPGATAFIGGKFTVVILDPSTDPGTLPAGKMSDRRPGSIDQGILIGHELGHAGYALGLLIPGPTNKAAVDLENHVRKARDPNAPTRKEH